MNIKLKSSALLVAMILGIVLSGLVAGTAILMSQYVSISGQSQDGEIAYRAALSGIEDGLLRYKYLHAAGQDSALFTGPYTENISDSSRLPQASYVLDYRVNSLTYGSTALNNFDYTPDGLNKQFDQLSQQTAQVDNSIDMDISGFFGSGKTGASTISTMKIDFSNPFYKDSNGQVVALSDYFTAMNYSLIDVSASGEDQLISEGTNYIETNKSLTIDGLAQCITKKCHLRFRPQVALNSAKSSLPNPAETHRLDQGNNTTAGKFVYFAIETYDGNDKIFEKGADKPGTITISSIGIAGSSRRKLDAKVDSTSGAYLGIFDYGVYCGGKCIFPDDGG